MTQCNTNQLLPPEFQEYYDKRRDDLSAQLDNVVRLISTPGKDTESHKRHRLILTARLTELDTARQTMEETEQARRQRDLDQFEENLNSDIDMEPRHEILKRYDVDDAGRITSPGKFEGEMLYAVYYWEWMLNGDGENMEDDDGTEYTVFDVAPEDRVLFPEIPNSIYKVALFEDSQGFVYLTDNACPMFTRLGTDEDRENRAQAAQEAQDA